MLSTLWDKVGKSRVGQMVRQGQAGILIQREPARLIFGLALFYAWNLTSIYTVPVAEVETHPLDAMTMQIVGTACYEITLIVIALALSRLEPRVFRGVTRAVAGVAGAVLLALSCIPIGWLPAELAASLFRGAGRIAAAFVLVGWGVEYCGLDGHSITVLALSGFMAGITGFLALAFVPLAVRSAVFSLLLPGSAFLLPKHDKSADSQDPEAPMARRGGAKAFVTETWRVLVVFFLFGTVEWVVMVNAQHTGSEAWFGSANLYIAAGSIAIVGILLIVSLSSGRLLTISYVYKVVIPLVFLGVIFAAAASADSSLGLTFMSVGFTCFDLFCFVTVAEVCARTGTNPCATFGWFRAIAGVPPIIGLLISASPDVWALFSSNSVMLLSGAMGVLVLSVSLLLDKGGVFVPESREGDGGAQAANADMLVFAEQYERAVRLFGIAPREAQVMSLIVRGRSIPYIADYLYLSRSTVKTYVARIYQKMAVGDRQEMIDAIERIPLE